MRVLSPSAYAHQHFAINPQPLDVPANIPYEACAVAIVASRRDQLGIVPQPPGIKARHENLADVFTDDARQRDGQLARFTADMESDLPGTIRPAHAIDAALRVFLDDVHGAIFE